MDESSSKLLQVILKYPKNGSGWIRKSSYNLWNCPFSSLWLTSGCTQNLFLLFALVLSRRAHTATDSTKSIPLTDSEENVRTLRLFHRPWAQPRDTRPLRQKKPLVCARPYSSMPCMLYVPPTSSSFIWHYNNIWRGLQNILVWLHTSNDNKIASKPYVSL
jgi:hypothetical protein